MKKSIMLSLVLTLIINNSYSQKLRYREQCDLIRNFLDTADRTFFNFRSITNDSTITILDVNELLARCSINSVDDLKIIIVSSGEEFEKVKKEGIFASSTRRKDFFILTKEYLNNLTGFRVYHPRTNGDCYWGFIEKNKNYYFKKKSFGWF